MPLLGVIRIEIAQPSPCQMPGFRMISWGFSTQGIGWQIGQRYELNHKPYRKIKGSILKYKVQRVQTD